MNPLQTIALWITKIIGKFFNPASYILGHQIFNQVVYLPIPMGSSIDASVRGIGYDMWINQISCDLEYAGDMVDFAAANRDRVTILIEDKAVNGQVFGSSGIELGTLHNIGQNKNFEGFLLKSDCNLVFTGTHISSNWTTGSSIVYAKIVLSGKKLDEKALLSITGSN